MCSAFRSAISLKAAFACVGLGTLEVLLFPDAGDVNAAEPCARVYLAHPDPAGAVLIPHPLPVPMELDLHACVFIRIYLLSLWAYDNGCLNSLNNRPWRTPAGPERQEG